MTGVDIQTERIDDIPLLVHQQQRMGIPEIVDEVIDPHGNWQGLSVGEMLSGWMSYILSAADHRMSEVEPWAGERQEMLSALFLSPVWAKDFADDRLANSLRWLSNDDIWEKIEQRVGQRVIRVYDLREGPMRLDSTTAAVYHDTEGNTLFRYGHSKDHRPDLAQFKVMLATLDPLGMPLATLVLPGNEADDGLYIPIIRQARPIVGQGGRLYIGDAKMSALTTRAWVQGSGDFYLTPMPRTGVVPELLRSLLEGVWDKSQPLERVSASNEDPPGGAGGKPKLLAAGYGTTRKLGAPVDGETVTWLERILVVYSPTLARRARRGLAGRLERAEQALGALTPPRGRGRRQWDDRQALQAAAQAILNKHRVAEMLVVGYGREVEGRAIRKYGSRPKRTQERVRWVIRVARNPAAIAEARRLMGWRLYVTNAPTEELSLSRAVRAYRGAPSIDRGFRRLKGRPLGIRPLYVRREDHATGMVRLLSLALRVLTGVEHVVRRQLRAAGETLNGLYAGNPKRATARPTTERLLKAFRGITLTMVQLPDQKIRHVTPLSELQQRILTLLGLSAAIYQNLASTSHPIPP
jgi:transposase